MTTRRVVRAICALWIVAILGLPWVGLRTYAADEGLCFDIRFRQWPIGQIFHDSLCIPAV